MSDEARPSTPDNGTVIMSAGEQPSSPDRGRRAASDDGEAAPGNEPTILVPSLIPSEHLLQIYDMASPPYACPRHLLKGMSKSDEEELHEARIFRQRVVKASRGSRPGIGTHWETLVELVDKLASRTSLRPWDTLSLTTQESLRRLFGGSAKPYYDTRYASAALVQAWLWHAIDDNLFSDPDKWATPQWKAYGTLCASFRDRAGTLDSAITPEERGSSGLYWENEFHFWRMLTMRMMVKEDPERAHVTKAELLGTNAAPHTSIDRLADRLMGKLAEIIDEASTHEDYVRRTARSAVFTDLAILGAWPHIMIAWRLPNMASAAAMQGHPFRESRALQNHDDMYESEGDSIDFVVSPGIFESGHGFVRYYEGIWWYPIRVAINGALDDPVASFRSFMTQNTKGSRVANH